MKNFLNEINCLVPFRLVFAHADVINGEFFWRVYIKNIFYIQTQYALSSIRSHKCVSKFVFHCRDHYSSCTLQLKYMKILRCTLLRNCLIMKDIFIIVSIRC